MSLDTLTRAVDDLIELGPSRYADAESVVALHVQLNRLEAVVTSATAAFDASDDWALDGAQDCAQWLATKTHVPKKTARRRLRSGARLRNLPLVEGSWQTGAIGEAQVASITALAKPPVEEAVRRDEAMLLGHATTLRYEAFTRALAYWRQLADPDGAERDADARRAERSMYLAKSFNGMWLGNLTLDPISGEIVHNELDRLHEELFLCDWTEAKERLGRDPTVTELGRTSDQRRVDALVEMAARSAAVPEGAQRPRPLYTVLVDEKTAFGRVCELASGTVVTPGEVAVDLLRAEIEGAVFTSPKRVEISAKTRLFTGATRRGVVVRDRAGCQHEFCDRQAGRCQVDHIVAYGEGGPTTQENGRLLCGFHNRLRNRLRNQRPPPPAA